MPYMLPHAIEMKAQEMARNLHLCQQGRDRIRRTERMWRYRSYQGGEPITMIDWRQSARGREIVVREHEPIVMRKVYFWADLSKALPHTQELTALLFLSLSRLLVQGERTVGWLGLEGGQTSTASMIDALFERGFRQEAPVPALSPLRTSMIVLAVDFTRATRQLYDTLRAYAAQGNQCILIDISGKGLHEESILGRKSWPVYPLDSQTVWPLFLPLLMHELMQSSR